MIDLNLMLTEACELCSRADALGLDDSSSATDFDRLVERAVDLGARWAARSPVELEGQEVRMAVALEESRPATSPIQLEDTHWAWVQAQKNILAAFGVWYDLESAFLRGANKIFEEYWLDEAIAEAEAAEIAEMYDEMSPAAMRSARHCRRAAATEVKSRRSDEQHTEQACCHRSSPW